MRAFILLYYLVIFLNNYIICKNNKTSYINVTKSSILNTTPYNENLYSINKKIANKTGSINIPIQNKKNTDLNNFYNNDLNIFYKVNNTAVTLKNKEKNQFGLKRNTHNNNTNKNITNQTVNEGKLGKINVISSPIYLISTENYQAKESTKIRRSQKLEIPTKLPYIASSTENKNHLPKKYIPSTTLKTINPQKLTNKDKGPTKVLIPVINAIEKRLESSYDDDGIICPKETEAKFNLFAPSCKTDSECTSWSKENRCCKLFGSRNCHKGVAKPLDEPSHKPFWGIARKCPERPLAELWWDLKTCKTDNDCWPRVCCPDGANRYCRTSRPEYESVPFQIGRPLAYFSEYLECTAPPPPIFDLHPKQCKSTFDCFPNICCQEAGKKHCRPPKKSVLTFMANFLNTGLIKRLTSNLVIKR